MRPFFVSLLGLITLQVIYIDPVPRKVQTLPFVNLPE